MESIIEYIDITSLGKYTTDTGIYRNNILDNLFDNNISTFWISNGFIGNIYIKFDSDINISKVQISNHAKEIISIYYSYNGVDYIKLSEKFLRPDLNNYTQYTEDFVFNNDVRTKYWKFVLSKNNGSGNYAGLQELKIYSKNFYKFLLKQNNQYYTFNNSEIVLSPLQELTEDNFKNNGFSNPSDITEEQWDNAFSDKTGLKLLMWTDDLDIAEIKAECEIEPFTPYDKLENEFEICMLTDKE